MQSTNPKSGVCYIELEVSDKTKLARSLCETGDRRISEFLRQ
jgi:hypothetical protein